jgi:hypothetical protein
MLAECPNSDSGSSGAHNSAREARALLAAGSESAAAAHLTGSKRRRTAATASDADTGRSSGCGSVWTVVHAGSDPSSSKSSSDDDCDELSRR